MRRLSHIKYTIASDGLATQGPKFIPFYTIYTSFDIQCEHECFYADYT